MTSLGDSEKGVTKHNSEPNTSANTHKYSSACQLHAQHNWVLVNGTQLRQQLILHRRNVREQKGNFRTESFSVKIRDVERKLTTETESVVVCQATTETQRDNVEQHRRREGVDVDIAGTEKENVRKSVEEANTEEAREGDKEGANTDRTELQPSDNTKQDRLHESEVGKKEASSTSLHECYFRLDPSTEFNPPTTSALSPEDIQQWQREVQHYKAVLKERQTSQHVIFNLQRLRTLLGETSKARKMQQKLLKLHEEVQQQQQRVV